MALHGFRWIYLCFMLFILHLAVQWAMSVSDKTIITSGGDCLYFVLSFQEL